MSTKYSSLLINTFLNASKQAQDDLYRASALSNLGQLCTVLKYSLGKDLSEVIDRFSSGHERGSMFVVDSRGVEELSVDL